MMLLTKLFKVPQGMPINSSKLENGTVITPLPNYYIELGLQCTKNDSFVQFFPRKFFKKIGQAVVDATKEGNKNLLSRAVAENLKLLGNSFYRY